MDEAPNKERICALTALWSELNCHEGENWVGVLRTVHPPSYRFARRLRLATNVSPSPQRNGVKALPTCVGSARTLESATADSQRVAPQGVKLGKTGS